MKSKIKYSILDGSLINAATTPISLNNRSFLYGDGLFESMHAWGTEVPLLDKHYERLVSSMKILRMEVPSFFSASFLAEQIARLCNKNRYYKNTRIRLNVFRTEGGLYTPLNNKISYSIIANELGQDQLGTENNSITLGLYTDIKKPNYELSSIKSSNSLIYVLAGIYKKEQAIDDCLLINQNDHIIETISSNIFIVKDNTISTPPISDGCLQGVMRATIIELLKQNGTAVLETSINIKDINNADEIFLTNAVTGITPVKAFESQRYFINQSRKLTGALNKLLFNLG